MRIKHLLFVLPLSACLMACNFFSDDKDSKKDSSQNVEMTEEEEDFDIPSTKKPKAFYATILDDFCNNYYDECYKGYSYVENSLTIIQVEYVSNEEAEIVGTHSYILPSGLQYSGEKFKAVVKDLPNNGGFEIAFNRETNKVLGSKSYWEPADHVITIEQ